MNSQCNKENKFFGTDDHKTCNSSKLVSEKKKIIILNYGNETLVKNKRK